MTHDNITFAALCFALWLLFTWGLHEWAMMPA